MSIYPTPTNPGGGLVPAIVGGIANLFGGPGGGSGGGGYSGGGGGGGGGGGLGGPPPGRRFAGRTKKDPVDPFAGYSSGGYWTGGSAGNGAIIRQMLAQVDAAQAAAAERYAQNKANYSNMYGQLTQKIDDYTPVIQQAFDEQIAGNQSRGEGNAAAVEEELARQVARRQASAEARGVSSAEAGLDYGSDEVLGESAANIRDTATNWGGLLAANRENSSERNRDLSSAASYAGTEAQKLLTDAYEAYLQNLDAQRLDIRGQYRAGSAGQYVPSQTGFNAFLQGLPASVQKEVLMQQLGLGSYAQDPMDQLDLQYRQLQIDKLMSELAQGL